MTPEDVALYYDNPENAQAMCNLLMRTHPGWTVWRVSGTRIWMARHGSWPQERPALKSSNAGLLNQAIYAIKAGDT